MQNMSVIYKKLIDINVYKFQILEVHVKQTEYQRKQSCKDEVT